MNTLRKIFLLAIITLCMGTAMAQQNDKRERVFAEMRTYKHKLLVEDLKLTTEQQRAFFPIYDQMEDKLQQINSETRELEKRVAANPEASDTEVEAAAAAVFEQKEREGKIEKEYFDQFKSILTPRQLLRIKAVEKAFTEKLLRQHRRLRNQK